jgi:hypothetical protein
MLNRVFKILSFLVLAMNPVSSARADGQINCYGDYHCVIGIDSDRLWYEEQQKAALWKWMLRGNPNYQIPNLHDFSSEASLRNYSSWVLNNPYLGSSNPDFQAILDEYRTRGWNDQLKQKLDEIRARQLENPTEAVKREFEELKAQVGSLAQYEQKFSDFRSRPAPYFPGTHPGQIEADLAPLRDAVSENFCSYCASDPTWAFSSSNSLFTASVGFSSWRARISSSFCFNWSFHPRVRYSSRIAWKSGLLEPRYGLFSTQLE